MGYLLVETQNGPMSDRFLADALALAAADRPVTVFLVADGVAAAVGPVHEALARIVTAGGRIWVDRFTLDQRALATAPLMPGAVIVTMATAAELIDTDGTRVVWH